MIYLALLSLAAGILYGLSGLSCYPLQLLIEHSDYILYLLMFVVGIGVSFQRGLLTRLKEHRVKLLLIPCLTTAFSLLGGVLCALITGYPLGLSISIAGGMGWYSLAGVTIGNIAGAHFGSVAFLSNLARELFAFFSIPFLSKRLNYYSCIAAAGATSEDTTLPILMKYTNEEMVIIAVVNGMLCSFAVPIIFSVFL